MKRHGNLKYKLLSGRSQSEKTTYYMIPTTWNSRKGNTVLRDSGAEGWGRDE